MVPFWQGRRGDRTTATPAPKRKRPGFPGRFHLLHQVLTDQNLYFRVSCIDQRDTPVLPLSLLFSWIVGVSVEPVKL